MLCYTPIMAIQHIRIGVPMVPEQVISTFVLTLVAMILRERYRLKYKKEAFSSMRQLLVSLLISVPLMTVLLVTTPITPTNKKTQDKIEDIATRVGNYFESITWLP